MSFHWKCKASLRDEDIVHSSVKTKGKVKITPRHNAFLDKLIDSQAHIIATVRGKDKYVLEEVNGKQVPRKVALGYEQRDGLEYLFTASFNIEQESNIASSVKDNTHIFENVNKVLDEKDGAKVYEWAMGADKSALAEIKASVEQGKKIMKENEEKEAEELNKNRQPQKKEVVEIINYAQLVTDKCTEIIKSDSSKQKAVMGILGNYGIKNPKSIKDNKIAQEIGRAHV